jgi:DtxR family transcriptional regulator, Mn-dependent transcriptional regulator
VELLERLTRRQVDALRAIGADETPDRGVPLRRVAAALGVRPPSALEHLSLLEDRRLVVRHRGKSRLTPRGRATLVEYLRHHRVAENLFRQLGLSPADTCSAALEMDLAISHRTVERVCAAEGHPSVCPHGEPIPPCDDARGSRRR